MYSPSFVPRSIHKFAVLAAVFALTAGAAVGQGTEQVTLGDEVAFGAGKVSSYVVLDSDGNPTVIGTQFDAKAIEAPPTGHSDMHHCSDRNGDGTVDQPGECIMTHEFVVPMPADVVDRDDIPFKWVLLNWNPIGHIPPGVYDSPHFDVHFMIASEDDIFAIKAGACGPEFVQCDQFETAKMALPANYIPADFKDVEAVVPAMGNHMIDVTGPEFAGVPFTRSWIYGNYGGKITFYEEMLTMDYLKSKPGICNPIKRADAVAVSGFYPTQSCVGFDENSGKYTVSMERFEYREAEPPALVTGQ